MYKKWCFDGQNSHILLFYTFGFSFLRKKECRIHKISKKSYFCFLKFNSQCRLVNDLALPDSPFEGG
jgi:hypothetical protein